MNQEFMYNELLEVKKIKQDRSIGELRRKRQFLSQAQHLVEKTMDSLKTYCAMRKEKQEGIYKFLTSQDGLSPKQLQLWRDKIAQLKEKEVFLADKADEAKEEYKKAQDELDKTRKEYIARSRDVQKFEQVTSVISEQNRKTEELKAEIEVEDLFQKGKEYELFAY